jgi:hypothetical protein
MSLLDPPRCPNCNSEVDLKELWRVAVNSEDAKFYPLAVACPVCGVKLRVLQGRAQWIGFLAAVVPFSLVVLSVFLAPVTRRSTDYYIRMGIFAVVMYGSLRLQQRNIPRLLTVRLLRDGEKVRFPLAPPTPVDPEAVPSSALLLEPKEDSGPSWVCPQCHEENPSNLNECWKCLAMRPDAGFTSTSGTP